MKLAFLITFLFFMSVFAKSHGRELNANERQSLLYLKENIQMKDYVFSKISTDELSLGEYATYKLSMNNCTLLEKKIDEIYRDDLKGADYSKELKSLNNECAQGIVGLFKMAVDNKLL